MEALKKIKRYQRITIFSLLIIMICAITFINSNLIWHSNTKSYIEKTFGRPMAIRGDIEYQYKGKKYRIILSTPKDKKGEPYLQCFQEKFGGLLYEPTYGASQGGSKALYGFTIHFIDGSNDSFDVVYGYNQELKANNFSVQSAEDKTWITQDISKHEYFLYTYSNVVYPAISFKDKENNDITKNFIEPK